MRKLNLRINEMYKYEVIKKLVESNRNKKATAMKLKCSTRHINRLINRYNAEGKKVSFMATE